MAPRSCSATRKIEGSTPPPRQRKQSNNGEEVRQTRGRSVSRSTTRVRANSVPSRRDTWKPTVALAPWDWLRKRETTATVWRQESWGCSMAVGSGTVPLDRKRSTLNGQTIDTDGLDRVLRVGDELIVDDAKLNRCDGRELEMTLALNVKCQHNAAQEHPWIGHGTLRDVGDTGATIHVHGAPRTDQVKVSSDLLDGNDLINGQPVMFRATYDKKGWSAVAFVALLPVLHWSHQDSIVTVVSKCRHGFTGVAGRYVFIPSSAVRESSFKSPLVRGAKLRALLVPNLCSPTKAFARCPLRALQLYPIFLDGTHLSNNNSSKTVERDLIQF